MVDEVVSQLHYPLCPNKKVMNKNIDEIIDTFGKSSKFSFSELALIFVILVTLKMTMTHLVGLTFGMRCIPFHLQRYLVLFHVKPLQSILE